LVNRIDVVRNYQRAHNFSMTVIRVTGLQLHAARVLVGLSPRLSLQVWVLAPLAEIQEPERACGEAGSRGRLEQKALALTPVYGLANGSLPSSARRWR
jgi:hypothetical protein